MKILVVGAGSAGLAMAAHLALGGAEVRLWNRTPLGELPGQLMLIGVSGVIAGKAPVRIANQDLVVEAGAVDLIVIATSALAHRELGIRLAIHGTSLPPTLIAPGHPLGAFSFLSAFQGPWPTVLEAQTAIHTSRRENPNTVVVHAVKRDVQVALVGGSRTSDVLYPLPEVIKRACKPSENWVATSVGNVGAILHPGPMLLNLGRVEAAQPFLFYMEGVTPSVARLVEALDEERLSLAEALGYRLPSLRAWLHNTYGVETDDLRSALLSSRAYSTLVGPGFVEHRYFTEEIPCGLIRLIALGRLRNVKMPLMEAVATLARSCMSGSALTYDEPEVLARLALKNLEG